MNGPVGLDAPGNRSLDGFVPWPPALVARYRATGLWEGLTVGDLLQRAAAQWPTKTALVAGALRLDYATLWAESRELAGRFAALGLRKGERVVVQLPNGPDFVRSWFALNLLGAIPVMALRAHRHAEVRHFLRASRAVAYLVPDVVGHFDFAAMAAELSAELAAERVAEQSPEAGGERPAHLRHVVIAGTVRPTLAWPAGLQVSALHGLPAPVDIPDPPRPEEVSTLLLSGGTTSLSKLIPRTHEDYVLNARLCSQVAGFDASTVLLTLLPLGHNYNLASPGLLGAIYRGATVVLAAGTGTEEAFALIEQERVSVVSAVVPLVTAWVNAPADGRDLSSLKVIQNGGARLAPELRRRLRERFPGCVPQEVYGTAEGLINMTRLDDPDELLLESSGAPVCDADEIRVVDDAGHDVPDGTPGELLTRGPYTIQGYFDAPEKNREAFLPADDGGSPWYRMGDIVRRQGRYVHTEGRRKDMINRGGEKISCEEVENLILAHPKVQAAVLVAMPDPVFGEKACACVVPQPGEVLGFEELITFLRGQQIASFKLPERLECFEALPVSPVGKILKRELRDIVAARLLPRPAVGREGPPAG